MALMDYLIGKKKDPMKEFAPYAQQAQGYYQPYADVSKSLAQDPAAYLENLMKGYQMSGGAKLQQDKALKAAGAASAAGGYRGTEQDLMDSARIADLIQGEDLQRYLANTMGLLGSGLQTGTNIAGQQAGITGVQGGLAAQQAQEANRQRAQLLGSLGGLAGTAVGAYFGGAPGAYAGGKLGSGQLPDYSQWLSLGGK